MYGGTAILTMTAPTNLGGTALNPAWITALNKAHEFAEESRRLRAEQQAGTALHTNEHPRL